MSGRPPHDGSWWFDPDPRHVDEDDRAYRIGRFDGTMSQPVWRRVILAFVVGILVAFAIGVIAGEAMVR